MALERRTQRTMAHGANAGIMTVIVVAIVMLIVGFSQRHRVRWDLSGDTAAALQEDTLHKIDLIEERGERIRITGFTFQQGRVGSVYQNRSVKDFFEELGYSSSSIDWTIVDFDRDRLTAESMGVREYGHLVIQAETPGVEPSEWPRVDVRARDLFRGVGSGEGRVMEFLGEGVFNRAVAQLLSERRQVIYALTGHGEVDVERSDASGMSSLASLLEQESYSVETLDLFRDGETGSAPQIPNDASALLIAGAQGVITEPEQAAIIEFMGTGGALMVLLDPELPVPQFIQRAGVEVMSGIVMDRTLVFPYNDRPVPAFGAHPITAPLRESNLVTVLSHIAPLNVSPPSWGNSVSLLETERTGWIERGGPMDGGTAVYQPEIDTWGPTQERPSVPQMAVAVELSAGEGSFVSETSLPSRMVVVGDTLFAANQLVADGPGNGAFLVNSFRWLVRDDERLRVLSRASVRRRLSLTAADRVTIKWLSLGLLPFLVSLLGMVVWSSRRGR
jgi:hypothetical protein